MIAHNRFSLFFFVFCLRHLTNSSILAYRKPLLYNLSVGRELLKQVYIAERLQPPTNFSTIKSAYSTLWSRASNPAYWKDITSSGEITKVGIYALEAYGIFKVCAGACSWFSFISRLTFLSFTRLARLWDGEVS